MKINHKIVKAINDENQARMEKCPSFFKCSKNLCPLDLDLKERNCLGSHEKCRWMLNPKEKKIGNSVFVSGGTVMSDVLLKFVPESNLKWLNESSQKRWHQLKKSINEK